MFSPLIWLAVFPEAQGSRASGPRTQRFWYNTKIRRTIQRPVANSDMVRHGSPPLPRCSNLHVMAFLVGFAPSV